MFRKVIDVGLVLVIVCGAIFAQTVQSDLGQTAIHTPSADKTSPTLQERHPRYRVSPSDVLSISFPLSPEIDQKVTVQPDGFINLKNAGSIYVQGQTTPEIVDTLTKAYAKILHNPIITVDLTNFEVPQFTIFGEVGRPGRYELRYETTVSEAIAVGGGFRASAKNQAFLLRRVSSDQVEVKKLNIKKIVHGKHASEDVQLQPGDMIYVPEIFIAKFRRYLPYSSGVGFSPQSLAQ